MQSNPYYGFHVHAAVTSFLDECCATLARLIAYVGAIALFAILGLNFWNQLQLDTAAAEPADQPGFTLAARSRPAFAVSFLILSQNQRVTIYSDIRAAAERTSSTGVRRAKSLWPSLKSTVPARSSPHWSHRAPILPRA
jgi:hypothetical protein